MKRRYVFAAALLFVTAFLAGCSGKEQPDITIQVQQPQSQEEVYSEKSVPLEGVDIGDLRDIEITPSGDPNCFLSPCDCNCYPIKNVPLTAKKPMCAMNCRQQYGISGCVFREYRCSAVQS